MISWSWRKLKVFLVEFKQLHLTDVRQKRKQKRFATTSCKHDLSLKSKNHCLLSSIFTVVFPCAYEKEDFYIYNASSNFLSSPAVMRGEKKNAAKSNPNSQIQLVKIKSRTQFLKNKGTLKGQGPYLNRPLVWFKRSFCKAFVSKLIEPRFQFASYWKSGLL